MIRKTAIYLIGFVFFTFLLCSIAGGGGHPENAFYSEDNNNIFYFTIISDTHIGSQLEAQENLENFLNTVEGVVNPNFIVNCGDLTDHVYFDPPLPFRGVIRPGTNQWATYRNMVDLAGMEGDIYSDAPGNHDNYEEDEDNPLFFYRTHSAQGRTTGNQTQRSWWPLGASKYQIVMIDTVDHSITDWSEDISWDPYLLTPAEINDDELAEIGQWLQVDSKLIFVVGHHQPDRILPVERRNQFINQLIQNRVSIYIYGHTHSYSDSSRLEGESLLLNVDSLWEHNQYAIVAVDNDGISVTSANLNQWPIVLITTPIDKNLGGENHYAYPVPRLPDNPIRALIFYDPEYCGMWSVRMLVNGEDIGGMNRVTENDEDPRYNLWEGLWNASELTPGEHTITVWVECALPSPYVPPPIVIGSDSITVEIQHSPINLEISSGLTISPEQPHYYVADTITAQFTIANKGTAPVTLDILTVGGRDPDDQVANFDEHHNITLNPKSSYNYQGSLTLSKVGDYHFFCTYWTPESDWNTSIPAEEGVIRTKDIIVKEFPSQDTTPPTTPNAPQDEGYQTSSTSLTFTWSPSSDSESGIRGYDITINSYANWPDALADRNGDNIYPAFFVGNVTSYTLDVGLSQEGKVIAASVMAIDNADNSSGWSPLSDGIEIRGAIGDNWDFNNYNDFEGWSVSVPGVSESEVNHWPTASHPIHFWIDPDVDPYIYSPELSLNSSIYNAIQFRMSSYATDKLCQVFFKTYGGYNEAQSLRFHVINDGLWHNYLIKLENISGWSGTITGIRVDPAAYGNTDESYDDIAFDYIKVVNFTGLVEGSLARTVGTEDVYFFKGGRKWRIVSSDIFDTLGYEWSDIIDYSSGILDPYPGGPDIVSEGSLIRKEGTSEVYLIENGKRRHVTYDAFINLGYRWENVYDVPSEGWSSLIALFPLGDDIVWDPDTIPPSVSVGIPSGGENWVAGSQQTIRWTATDNVGIDYIDIYYTTNGWASSTNENSSLPNTGSYSWTVPSQDTNNAAIRVVAYDTSGNSADAYSGTFSISSIVYYPDLYTSSLSVDDNTPDVGQQITIWTTVTNQGDASSGPTNLKYYFSSTSAGKENYLGESSISSLSAGFQISVAKTVTIPDIGVLEAYIVAVVNPNNSIQESNTSNNTASITITVQIQDNEPPTISYLELHGGIFKTEHEYNIVFEVSDNVSVDTLDFYFSIDNGATWDIIETGFIIGSHGIANAYKWTILPSSITEDGKIKMVAWDTSGNQAEAITDPFTIVDGTSPEITVLSPNGGEVWDLESQHAIIYEASSQNGIQRIEIDLFIDGNYSRFISEETVNDGICNWTLPSISGYITDKAQIRIKILDGNWNEAEDWSDDFFSINDPSTPPPPPWNELERITGEVIDTTVGHNSPRIAADGSGNIHMAYRDGNQILYKKRTGSAWSSASFAYENTKNHGLTDLQIAVDSNNNPHIVWKYWYGSSHMADYNYDEIYYTYYNGSSWIAPINISDNSKISDFSWITKSDMPESYFEPSVSVVSGEIYVFLGNDNYKYDPASDSWIPKTDNYYDGIPFSPVVIDNKIYSIRYPFYDVLVYDPSDDSWELKPNSTMITGRSKMMTAAVNGKLYAIGNYGSSGGTKNEMYDPVANEWTSMADMPTPRGWGTAAIVDNLIYVIGGRTYDPDQILKKVEIYDSTTDTWSEIIEMFTKRERPVAGVINGRIYVVGGYGGTYNEYLNAVEVYDPAIDRWLRLSPMAVPRSGSGGAVVGDKFYVMGGDNNESGYLATVEEGTITGETDPNPTGSTAPRVAIDPLNNVHIVWRDGYYWDNDENYYGSPKIFYRKKDFVTDEWSQTEQLLDSFSFAAISADNSGGLHVVALEDETMDIYYLNWDGIEWSTPVKAVYPNYSGYYSFEYLEITTDSNDYPHIAWRSFFKDEDEISWQQILYSSFNGSTWSEIEEVSDRILGYQYRYPSIVTDSTNRPHIIWFTEETGGGSFSAIEYKNRSSLGWSISMYIIPDSHRPQGSTEPCSLTISNDDQLHVAWVASYSGNSEIFYNNADVSQDVWPPAVQLLTPTAGQTIPIGGLFDITWTCTDDVEVSSISLDYTTDGGENYTNIESGLSNDEIFPWTPDILSDTVQIRITAYDGQGNVGSDISGIFTITDFTHPTVTLISPNGGEVWEADSQQSVIWEASDNIGISSTDLFYSIDNGTTWTIIATDLKANSSYLWKVPPQIASTYRVKVIAVDEENNLGEDMSDGTFSVILDNNPPYEPSNPLPGNGDGEISINTNLNWQGGDPDSGDTVTYDVYFGTSTNPSLVSEDQSETTFNPGISNYNKFYYWKIVATDNHGASSLGLVWSFITEIEPKPDPPTNLSATAISSSQIDLNWQDNSDNEIGFKIERKTGSSGSYSQIYIVAADTVSYTDAGLSGNTTYYYQVRAYNASGNSGYSNEDYATTSSNDSCSDSDGGNVITTAGTTSGFYNGSSFSHNDYCVNSDSVMEYYCSGDYAQSQQQSCGTDGYGSPYCTGDSVYRDYTDYYCSSGACDSSTTSYFQEDCNSQDGYVGNNYCMNGDVYRDYKDYYCSSGACNNTTSHNLIQDCAYGCENGACLPAPACISNEDCGIDGYIGDNFCFDGDVYRNYRQYTCNNPGAQESYCSHEDTPMQQEECSNLSDQCNDGICNLNTHECVKQPKPNGTSCDDEIFCNGDDTCSDGNCSVHSGDPCYDPTPQCDDENDRCVECLTGADCDEGFRCDEVEGVCEPTPEPDITVTDSLIPDDDLNIPFGDIYVTAGSSLEATVTITNDGDDDLIIYDIADVNTLEPPFSIETDNCSGETIETGESCILTVRFEPITTGQFDNTFDIPSNDPDEDPVTITVGGTGSSDNDGLPDQEEQGPDGTDTNYDGNNDGTADKEQNNVASLNTYDSQNYVTLASPDTLSDVHAIDNPSPGDSPAGTDFPCGFFEFTIEGVEIGGATTVTIFLPEGVSLNTYWKYGPTPDDPSDHWYEFLYDYDGETGAEINGNEVTLHFIDGQRGDHDLTQNGTIVEPGGPGEKETTTSSTSTSSTSTSIYYSTTTIAPPPDSTTTTTGDTSTTTTVDETTTTTSIETTSSTTSSIRWLWPMAYDKMWGEKKDEKLLLIRVFRDEILLNTKVGKDYIFMLYDNSFEIAVLLLQESSLTLQTREVLDELLLSVESLLYNDEIEISQNTIDKFELLLDQFETKASLKLKTAISKLKRDINRGETFEQLGITISE